VKKRLFLIAGVVCLMVLMVFIKVYLSSAIEHQRGEAALSQGEYEAAITHFERSIHWFTPVNRYVARSLKRLWDIGEEFEQKGEKGEALKVYRTVRSSLYAVRSFYTPYPELIHQADEKIATLVSSKDTPGFQGKSVFERREETLALLKKDYAPHPGWSILLEIGFLGWVGCAIGLILRAFGGENQFYGKRALFWGSFVVFFYTLWVIGMTQA